MLMKLDIEGAEWTVLPDLMASHALCALAHAAGAYGPRKTASLGLAHSLWPAPTACSRPRPRMTGEDAVW